MYRLRFASVDIRVLLKPSDQNIGGGLRLKVDLAIIFAGLENLLDLVEGELLVIALTLGEFHGVRLLRIPDMPTLSEFEGERGLELLGGVPTRRKWSFLGHGAGLVAPSLAGAHH